MDLYTAAKDAIAIAQKLGDIELIERLREVQKDALDLQEKNFKLLQENDKLRREKDEILLRLNKKEAFVLDLGVYWLKKDSARKQPFRAVCMAHDFAIPMEVVLRNGRPHYYKCQNKDCHNIFDVNPVDAGQLPNDSLFDKNGFY